MPSKIGDNFRVFPEAAMAFRAFSFFCQVEFSFPAKDWELRRRVSNGFLLAWCTVCMAVTLLYTGCKNLQNTFWFIPWREIVNFNLMFSLNKSWYFQVTKKPGDNGESAAENLPTYFWASLYTVTLSVADAAPAWLYLFQSESCGFWPPLSCHIFSPVTARNESFFTSWEKKLNPILLTPLTFMV